MPAAVPPRRPAPAGRAVYANPAPPAVDPAILAELRAVRMALTNVNTYHRLQDARQQQAALKARTDRVATLRARTRNARRTRNAARLAEILASPLPPAPKKTVPARGKTTAVRQASAKPPAPVRTAAPRRTVR